MIHINYPNNLSKFKEEYISKFEETSKEGETLEGKFNEYFDKRNFEGFEELTLETLLIASFKDLCEWSFKLNIQLECTTECTKKTHALNCDSFELKSILNYDKENSGYRDKISLFFQENHEKIYLSTCYFCNISYVHAFENRGDFIDIVDFVNTATEQEFKQLYMVGGETIKKIMASRSINTLDDLELTPGRLKYLIDGYQDYNQTKKQFTLDHVLDKGKHPLVALSLYNLLPACYSCNSLFKKSQEIVRSRDEHYFSPTSPDFEFQNNFRFQILFDKEANAQVNTTKDFHLKPQFDSKPRIVFKPRIDLGPRVKIHLRYDLIKYLKSPYENYLTVFRILPRYRKHKSMVLDLINKQKKYSPAHIKKIAETIGSTEGKVREDIFGPELFRGKCETEPFTKFKRDIAQNIKLEGAKTSRHGDE